MAQDEIFFDIGANIGVYSLFAAQRGLRVFSFEPHSSSFDCLVRNIELNRYDNQITALPLSIHNSTGISCLYLADTQSGKSGHAFGAPINQEQRKFKEVARQSCIGYRLDELIRDFNLPVPNHIKIDVDGNELLILESLGQGLQDQTLRSLMVEGPMEQTPVFLELILSSGFVEVAEDAFRNYHYESEGTRNYFFSRHVL